MSAIEQGVVNRYDWDQLSSSNVFRYAFELVETGFSSHRYFTDVRIDGPFDLMVKRGFFDRRYAIQVLPARSFGTYVAADVNRKRWTRAVLALVLMIPGIPDFTFLIPDTHWSGRAPLLETHANEANPDGPPVRVLNLTEENLPLLLEFTFDRVASAL